MTMGTDDLIPPGGTTLDTSANFQIKQPAPDAPAPREAQQWDDFQAHMRATLRPSDRGETERIPCVTPRGSKFTAVTYKPKRREHETEEMYQARPPRVSSLDDYRFPGDGWRDPQSNEPDEMSYHTDPRTGRRILGKDDQGNYTHPVEVRDQMQRKVQLMKTWWHRDLAEFCGKPLPMLIRADHAAELEEFRAWKAKQAEAEAKRATAKR